MVNLGKKKGAMAVWGRDGGFGIDMYTLQYLKWTTTRSPYCIAQGTLLNVTGSLDGRGVRENGYVYMYMYD